MVYSEISAVRTLWEGSGSLKLDLVDFIFEVYIEFDRAFKLRSYPYVKQFL